MTKNFAYFKKGNVELTYSWFMFFGFSKQKWFCRLWDDRHNIIGESYGGNKFEAYKNAVIHRKK